MKLLLLIQFLLFSMFSISQIDHVDLSGNVIYIEQGEVNSPVVDNNPIKPIKDITFKYINLSRSFSLSKSIKLTHQFETKEIFNSHLVSTQLARSPPSSIS